MRRNQAVLITIVFVLGIFTGLMSDLIGINPGKSNLQEELDLANANIKWLNDNITEMREIERSKFIKLNLRVGELSNIISERRGIWITSVFENNAPVFYDSNIANSLTAVNKESLVFEDTAAASHDSGSSVINLSVLFLQSNS